LVRKATEILFFCK